MFPDASTKTGRPEERARAHHRATVSGRWLSMRMRSAPAESACESSASDSTSTSIESSRGRLRLRRRDGARDAAGEPAVVVLDEDHLGQIVSVIPAAPVSDRLAVERAQPRHGLSGVEDLAAGAGDGVDESPRRRRDPAHPLEEIEGHALGRQDRAGAARTGGRASRAATARAGRRSRRTTRGRSRAARTPAARPGGPRRRRRTSRRALPRVRVPGGTVASVVTSRRPTSSERNSRRRASRASPDRRLHRRGDYRLGRPSGREDGRLARLDVPKRPRRNARLLFATRPPGRRRRIAPLHAGGFAPDVPVVPPERCSWAARGRRLLDDQRDQLCRDLALARRPGWTMRTRPSPRRLLPQPERRPRSASGHRPAPAGHLRESCSRPLSASEADVRGFPAAVDAVPRIWPLISERPMGLDAS